MNHTKSEEIQALMSHIAKLEAELTDKNKAMVEMQKILLDNGLIAFREIVKDRKNGKNIEPIFIQSKLKSE